VIVFAIALTGCAQPEPESESQEATPAEMPSQQVAIDGMRNITTVDNVTIGAQPSQTGLEEAAAMGFTVVVSNRAPGEIDWNERAVADSLGLQFVSIPMSGPVTEITDEQIAGLDAVISTPGAKVLLHCASGNRASGLWAAWLVEKRGISAEDAFDLAIPGGLGSVRPAVERRIAALSNEQ
jgi:uncharacterized protein (TIGR01244 family)